MSSEPEKAPKFHDFRIGVPDVSGHTAEVWLDGMKLRGVLWVETRIDVKDATIIRIEFIAGSLNKEYAGLAEMKK